MWKLSALLLACCILLAAPEASSQASNPCSVTLPPGPGLHSDVGVGANKVACTLPQLFGKDGLVFPANGELGPIDQHPNIGSRFTPTESPERRISSSLNSNVAGQIALLPFVAPASGISFTFDPSLHVYAESQDSFGPIFSERASTIGKHRLSVGVAYQYFNFDSLGGINLHNFPAAYIQDPVVVNGDPNCPNSLDPIGIVICRQAHDYVTSATRIDLEIHQITSFVTFGLTRTIDLSIAVPYVRVQMAATADSTVAENGGGTEFAGCNGVVGDCGLHNVFSNNRHASGLGDISFRAKVLIKKWERSGLAGGVDVRTPTGDAINFLGAGAVGIKPFLVWSRSGRVSPHVNVGYEWNGKSILGADITTGAKHNLPGEFVYSVGVESAVTRRLTATLDLVGQRVFNGPTDSLAQVTAPSPCTFSTATDQCLEVGPQTTTIGISTGDYWINNGNIGLRLRAFRKLLITGSVLLKLDNGGLRSKATPLASATYTFW